MESRASPGNGASPVAGSLKAVVSLPGYASIVQTLLSWEYDPETASEVLWVEAHDLGETEREREIETQTQRERDRERETERER